MYIEGVYRGRDGANLLVAYPDTDRDGNTVERVVRCFVPDGVLDVEPALGSEVRVTVVPIQKRLESGQGYRRMFLLVKDIAEV